MQFSNMYTLLAEGISAERVNCLACCRYIYIRDSRDWLWPWQPGEDPLCPR